ncbi:MAG TPA: DUF885 domain-containing protein [Candidatus Limnocylindria bacterium]|nr:DUF885 domain-containing protein [Candidatus Limnocylindria bacterium]
MSDASTALGSLAEEYWQAVLEADPLWATQLGHHDHDGRLPPVGADERHVLETRLAAQRDAVSAISVSNLRDEERVTHAALLAALDADVAFLRADLRPFTVDPMSGPQVEFLNIPDYQVPETVTQGRAMIERWRAMGPWITTLTARQREALAEGRPPVRILVERVIAELDELLGQPDEAWPLAAPARATPEHWGEADRRTFADDLLTAVREGIRPAFAAYREFLREAALPAARGDEAVGLGHLEGGAATYRSLARAHTTLDATPEELHAIGLREIERIDEELRSLGGRLLGARDLPDALRRLRTDSELHFATGEEIVEVAIASLERANAAIPDWFNLLPQAPCEVVPMGAHEEEHSTIAYYRDPAADGSRPGRYHVNRSHPQTRPRYEAEALAFHEAVPGHHLQVALAQERSELPAFRRHSLTTAYVEGWGLYAERLADEMGLYSGDLDRIGIASFDAWRASRLVVDTGMHALGWSRSRAIAFMTEHTALGLNNIANEVDRYIAWPGQALAYKLGQLEILRLREEARARQGADFDIRRFHDAVLGPAPLPLAVLRQVVERQLT